MTALSSARRQGEEALAKFDQHVFVGGPDHPDKLFHDRAAAVADRLRALLAATAPAPRTNILTGDKTDQDAAMSAWMRGEPIPRPKYATAPAPQPERWITPLPRVPDHVGNPAYEGAPAAPAPQPEATEFVRRFPEPTHVLVGRVVSAAHARYTRAQRRRVPFWSVIGDIFCTGSGHSAQIARACGYDPDTGEPDDAEKWGR